MIEVAYLEVQTTRCKISYKHILYTEYSQYVITVNQV